jgi:hypothetical protein
MAGVLGGVGKVTWALARKWLTAGTRNASLDDGCAHLTEALHTAQLRAAKHSRFRTVR